MELHEVLFSVGGQGVADRAEACSDDMRIRARNGERSVFLFQVLTRPARGFVYYIKDSGIGYRSVRRPRNWSGPGTANRTAGSPHA